jgi:hypothetical protein
VFLKVGNNEKEGQEGGKCLALVLCHLKKRLGT